jgi:hypothetical protein
MTYRVLIEAQARWETDVDADSEEEAKGFAVKDFHLEINDAEVLIINKVIAREAEGEKSEDGD